MIYTLNNPVKNFPWGSRTAIRDYFGIDNSNLEHQAEIWMGAHPSASSSISQAGVDISLCDVIASNPDYWLGKETKENFSSLPFLMKVIAAEEPLSIQVHPSKKAAELGFAKENEQGIPLDAANRNYKDANHKPELVYALTPYLAMNGFREFAQIVANFDAIDLPVLEDVFQPFKQAPNPLTLAEFFAAILTLKGELKAQAISQLLNALKAIDKDHFAYQASLLISRFSHLYPEDVGLFAPLFLNVIELQPGEAMFLYAETPHAYIHGLGVEVMANSDNVLRAGLTPKHIDVEELIANTKFTSTSLSELKLLPLNNNGRMEFPIPVEDFRFEIIKNHVGHIKVNSPEILLCIDGMIEVVCNEKKETLDCGGSLFISGGTDEYKIKCNGILARVYV
ncbi:mannose-6-phosphate isomerase, class I [Vibrio parahaemolyticus]|uniref:mannose-6-phosphate isomerase n=2 Tax=Vibrio parahaemolyticus TaxID=670 RepID=A0A5P1PMV0_VIBPH|nr:mannose-6-phosphate isomerase, class I [Vibrio parahaemolyticus]EGR3003408.1 mannose-6-phosphate isomerase, class I [Vibrio parahaemolyticus]EJG1708382.1 mannose-6-phosphate isomerase, class I [Vibrio parahaemolyticus]EJG1744737.1 mannose-6-phosphate isomerase, class I [Vibrio parahaemolyticus]EJG1779520.1 mannose-6-phosphate isomerase, class I [Vibrio parahaemolyticus]EJH0828384.1 mannose-6-phosphate isomerase, class I [Vibrio parahaemolyticus]